MRNGTNWVLYRSVRCPNSQPARMSRSLFLYTVRCARRSSTPPLQSPLPLLKQGGHWNDSVFEDQPWRLWQSLKVRLRAEGQIEYSFCVYALNHFVKNVSFKLLCFKIYQVVSWKICELDRL